MRRPNSRHLLDAETPRRSNMSVVWPAGNDCDDP